MPVRAGRRPRDYYDILGVGRDASADELRRSFRAKARELHPDVSEEADAAERFREVAQAYRVLSRPHTREVYDRLGSGRLGLLANSRIAFTTGPGGRRPAPAEIELHYIEAVHGARRTLLLPEQRTCLACDGRGSDADFLRRRCAPCEGKGVVRFASESDHGRLLRLEACDACAGTGTIPSDACEECGGTGRVIAERPLRVRIPAGVEDGQRLRVLMSGDGADDGEVVVRVGAPPPEARLVRYGAAVAAVGAVAFLLNLLFS